MGRMKQLTEVNRTVTIEPDKLEPKPVVCQRSLVLTEEGRGVCVEDETIFISWRVQECGLRCGRGAGAAIGSPLPAHHQSLSLVSGVQKAEEWGKLLALKSAVFAIYTLCFKTGCCFSQPVTAVSIRTPSFPDSDCAAPYCYYDITFVRTSRSNYRLLEFTDVGNR